MALFPTFKATIGDRVFTYCKSFVCTSDWTELTDTGRLVVPGKFRTRTGVITVGSNNVFRSGQLAAIEAGYYPNSSVIFEGYVKSVKPGYEVELELEDAAYLLKRYPVSRTWKAAKLKTVVTELMQITAEAIQADGTLDAEIRSSFLSGISRVGSGIVVDAGLGDFKVTNATAAQVLDQIRTTYGISSYFRGFNLYVGLPYIQAFSSSERRGVKVTTGTGGNWLPGDSLVYQRADEQRIKVVVKSLQPDNSVIEVEAGDSFGNTKTIFVFGETDLKKLKKIGDDSVIGLKYEGYRGEVSTFGRPTVRHGDLIQLFDYRFPDDRTGLYYIQAVETSTGFAGYRQRITLGSRA